MTDSTMATMNYRKNIIYDRIVREITEEFRSYVEYNFDEEEGWEEFKEVALQVLYNHDIDYPVEEDYDFLVFFLCVANEHNEPCDTQVEWDKPQKIVNFGYYFIAQEIFGDFKKEEFVG